MSPQSPLRSLDIKTNINFKILQKMAELKSISSVAINADETVIMGLSIGFQIDLNGCKVEKLTFDYDDGTTKETVTVRGREIPVYGVKLKSGEIISLGKLRKCSPTALSELGKAIKGRTKSEVENSLRSLKKWEITEVVEVPNEAGTGTMKYYQWKQL